MAPTVRSESKSRGRSRCAAVRQPPEGPPIWTALNASAATVPSSRVTPPPMLKMISRRVVPKGTSISPVLTTCPVRANVFVPGEPAVPCFLKAAAPWLRISGTVASVSTLLMTVGLPHNPDSAGNGGLGDGMPRRPSIEAMSAVSSPHTNAPAPSMTFRQKRMPVPMQLSPRMPAAVASATALRTRFTASGYSARTYRYPSSAPMARAAISMPSRTRCGFPSITLRSMKAPGSPSSPLQMTYFRGPGCFRVRCHLRPVGNPPPPRPRNPASETRSHTASALMAASARYAARYPSWARYSARFSGSIRPHSASTARLCFW